MINKIVDYFLVLKKLKVILVLLLIILCLLISNSFFKWVCIDEKVFAAYMIALSALMASTVAMINITNSTRIASIKRCDEVIALMNLGTVKINFFIEKSKLLKLMLSRKSEITNEAVLEYILLLENILDYLNNKEIYSVDELEFINIRKLHNEIFIKLILLKKIEKKIESCIWESEELYDAFIKVLNDFVNELQIIRDEYKVKKLNL